MAVARHPHTPLTLVVVTVMMTAELAVVVVAAAAPVAVMIMVMVVVVMMMMMMIIIIIIMLMVNMYQDLAHEHRPGHNSAQATTVPRLQQRPGLHLQACHQAEDDEQGTPVAQGQVRNGVGELVCLVRACGQLAQGLNRDDEEQQRADVIDEGGDKGDGVVHSVTQDFPLDAVGLPRDGAVRQKPFVVAWALHEGEAELVHES